MEAKKIERAKLPDLHLCNVLCRACKERVQLLSRLMVEQQLGNAATAEADRVGGSSVRYTIMGGMFDHEYAWKEW